MQTNFQDRQSALITEAVQTIQEQVKLKGSPSFLDMEIQSIPYTDGNLWFDETSEIAEICKEYVFSEDGDDCGLYAIDCDTLMKIADYCLNYNPSQEDAK
jgi:hypothetical protein